VRQVVAALAVTGPTPEALLAIRPILPTSPADAARSTLALFIPAGASTSVVRALVSDGCSSRVAESTVVAACPSGLVAEAGPAVTVTSNALARSSATSTDLMASARAGALALLAGTASGSSAAPSQADLLLAAEASSPFSAVILRASASTLSAPASNATSYFWELVSAPPASALPAALRSSVVGGGVPVSAIRRGIFSPLRRAGAPLAGAYGAAAALIPDVEGDFTVRLSVSDGCSHSTDLVVVTAACAEPPVPAVAPSAGETVAVTLPGGGVVRAPVVRVGSELAAAANATAIRAAASLLAGTALTAGQLPVPVIASMPSVRLNGSLSSPLPAPRGVAFEWSLLSLPRAAAGVLSAHEVPCAGSRLSDACLPASRSRATVLNRRSVASAELVFDGVGDYTVALTASDNCTTRTVPAVIAVRCNAPPTADAGGHLSVMRGPSNAFVAVALDGSRSTDPDAADATRLRYHWELLSAPAGSALLPPGGAPASRPFASGAFSSSASFTPDVNGVFEVRLTVSDWCSSSSDVIAVTVGCNNAPRAGVNGPRQTVRFNASAAAFPAVVLDGTYSHDPDGLADLTGYTWKLLAVQSPTGGFAQSFGSSGGPDYTAPIPAFGRRQAVLFAPPTQRVTATTDTMGGASSVLYTLSLGVSDGCSSDSAQVVVEALCPQSPFAQAAAAPETITWNSRPGSRFGTQRAVHSARSAALSLAGVSAEDLEAAACSGNATVQSASCAARVALSGVSKYLHAGQDWRWSVVSVPASAAAVASLLTSPAQPGAPATGHQANASLVLPMSGFEATRPFDAASLGSSLQGSYALRFTVGEPCVASAAEVQVVLRCNDPPSAVVASSVTLAEASSDTGLFAAVQLSSAGTAPSAAGNASEAVLDGPTFRFEWDMTHYPVSDAEARDFVPTVTGADPSTDVNTGSEASAGFHHLFVTSTGYTGALGGVAGGDAKCQRHAELGGHAFPGDFKALLCTSGASAFSRITPAGPVHSTLGMSGGYRDPTAIGRTSKLVCGPSETGCVETWAAASWLQGYAYDEFGAPLPGTNPTIGGCDPQGNVIPGGTLCNDWTSSSSAAVHAVGNPYASGTQRYRSFSVRTCSQPAHLICARSIARTAAAIGMPVGPLQTLNPTFVPKRLGTYVARLRVTDGCTAAEASVNITARCPANAAIPVDVGPDFTVRWSRRSLASPGSFGIAQATVRQPGLQVLGQWTVESETFVGAVVKPTDEQPGGFTFAAAVLGNSSNAADLPASQNLRAPAFTPGALGTYRFRFSVPGGCVVSNDEIVVNATCNTPPVIRPPTGGDGNGTLVSRWNGTAFGLVGFSGLASDADGDAITHQAGVVAPGHNPPAVPPPNTEAAVLGPDAAAVQVVAAGADARLTPTRLGSWTLLLSASDGCTVVRRNVSVRAECSGSPVARVRGSTGAPLSSAAPSAGSPAPHNASVFVDGAAPGSRSFGLVTLDAASASTDDDVRPGPNGTGVSLRFRWAVSGYAAVNEFATSASAGASGSADDAAGAAAFLARLSPAFGGSSPSVGFESAVAAGAAAQASLNLTVPRNASLPQLDAAVSSERNGVVAASLAGLGRWLVTVTASDGCTRNATSALLASRCSVPPVAKAGATVVSPSGSVVGSAGASSVTSRWGGGRPDIAALLSGSAAAFRLAEANYTAGVAPFSGTSVASFAPVVVDASMSVDDDMRNASLSAEWRLVRSVFDASLPAGATAFVPARVPASDGGTGGALPVSLSQMLTRTGRLGGLSAGLAPFRPVVTGAAGGSSPALTFLPPLLGTYTLEVSVTDSCSRTTAFVSVTAACNAPPAVSLPAAPVVALWKGATSGFGSVTMTAAVSDADADTLSFDWSATSNATSIADSSVNGTLALQPTSPGAFNFSAPGGIATLTPRTLARRAITVSVDDGCTSTAASTVVETRCPAAPVVLLRTVHPSNASLAANGTATWLPGSAAFAPVVLQAVVLVHVADGPEAGLYPLTWSVTAPGGVAAPELVPVNATVTVPAPPNGTARTVSVADGALGASSLALPAGSLPHGSGNVAVLVSQRRLIAPASGAYTVTVTASDGCRVTTDAIIVRAECAAEPGALVVSSPGGGALAAAVMASGAGTFIDTAAAGTSTAVGSSAAVLTSAVAGGAAATTTGMALIGFGPMAATAAAAASRLWLAPAAAGGLGPAAWASALGRAPSTVTAFDSVARAFVPVLLNASAGPAGGQSGGIEWQSDVPAGLLAASAIAGPATNGSAAAPAGVPRGADAFLTGAALAFGTRGVGATSASWPNDEPDPLLPARVALAALANDTAGSPARRLADQYASSTTAWPVGGALTLDTPALEPAVLLAAPASAPTNATNTLAAPVAGGSRAALLRGASALSLSVAQPASSAANVRLVNGSSAVVAPTGAGAYAAAVAVSDGCASSSAAVVVAAACSPLAPVVQLSPLGPAAMVGWRSGGLASGYPLVGLNATDARSALAAALQARHVAAGSSSTVSMLAAAFASAAWRAGPLNVTWTVERFVPMPALESLAGASLIGADGAMWERAAVASAAEALTSPDTFARFVGGAAASAFNGSSVPLAVTAPGVVSLRVVVSDGCQRLVHAVTVNTSCPAPPIAEVLPPAAQPVARWAGAAFAPVALGSPLANASAAFPDSALTFNWTVVPGSFVAAAPPAPARRCNASDPSSPSCQLSHDPAVTASPALTLASNASKTTVATATGLGSWAVRLGVSDGCRANASSAAVVASCNAAPDLSLSSVASVASLSGTSFSNVTLQATAADASDPITVTWRAVSHDPETYSSVAPDHASLGRMDALPRLDGAEPLGLAGLVRVTNATSTVVPQRLGETTLAASVSDGCSVVSRTATVRAVCAAPPPLPDVFPGAASIALSFVPEHGGPDPASLVVSATMAGSRSDGPALAAWASSPGLASTATGTAGATVSGTSIRMVKAALDTAAEQQAATAAGIALPLPPIAGRNVTVAFLRPSAADVARMGANSSAATAVAAHLRECAAALGNRSAALAAASANASASGTQLSASAAAAVAVASLPAVPSAPLSADQAAAVPALGLNAVTAPCGGNVSAALTAAMRAGGVNATAADFMAALASSAANGSATVATQAAAEAGAVRADAAASLEAAAAALAERRRGWSFLGWVLVGRTCPSGVLDAASPSLGSDHVPSLLAHPSVQRLPGQCVAGPLAGGVGPQGSTLPALVSNGSLVASLAPQGVGTYTLRWAAFDGCTVARGDVDVEVACNPAPVPRLSAFASRRPPSLGAPGYGVAADDVRGVEAVVTTGNQSTVLAALVADGRSAVLPSAAAALVARGVPVAMHVAASPVTATSTAERPRLPAIVLNASTTLDVPDAASMAGAPQPLRFLWDVVAAPSRSRLLGLGGISHPNATSTGLASRSPSSATGTYGPAGVGSTEQALAILRAGNGSAAAHAAANAANPEAVATFTPDEFGRYVVRLTVHDGCSVRSALVVVDASCTEPPVASAGADRAVRLADGGGPALPWPASPAMPGNSTVSLDASGTTDPDWSAQDTAGTQREPVFVQWSVVSAPEGAAFALLNASSMRPRFRPSAPGAYTFRLHAANVPAADLSAAAGSPTAPVCPVSTDTVTITAACGPLPPAMPSVVAAVESGRWSVRPAGRDPVLASAAAGSAPSSRREDNATLAMAQAAARAASAAAPMELPLAVWAAAAREVAWAAAASVPGASFGPVVLTAGSSGFAAGRGLVTPLRARWRLVSVPAASRSATMAPGPAMAAARLAPFLTSAILASTTHGSAAPSQAEIARATAGLFVPGADDGAIASASRPGAWSWPAIAGAGAQYAALPAEGSLVAAAPGAGAVTGANATLLPDVAGVYTVRLEVTDGCTAASGSVDVTVACDAAPALALSARSHSSPSNVTVLVPSSSSPSSPPAATVSHTLIGVLASYLAATEAGSSTAVATDSDGAVILRPLPSGGQALADAVVLTTSDAAVMAALAPVQAPLAVAAGALPAGSSALLRAAVASGLASAVTLSAAPASAPAGAAPLAFGWSLVSGPASSIGHPLVTSAASSTAQLYPDVPGQYVVRVSATDGCSADGGSAAAATTAASALVNVTCSAPPAIAVASSLVTALFRSGGVTVSLPAANVSDPDARDLVAWRWVLVSSTSAGAAASGPSSALSAATVVPANGTATLRVTQPGSFTLQVVATDGCTRIAAPVVVNVLCPTPASNPLVASAASGRSAVVRHVPGTWLGVRGAFDYSALLAAAPASDGSSLASRLAAARQLNASLPLQAQAEAALAPLTGAVSFRWSVATLPPSLDGGGEYVVLPAGSVVLDRVTLRSASSGDALSSGGANASVAGTPVTEVRWSVESAPAGAMTASNPTVSGAMGPVISGGATLRPSFAPSLAGTYRLRVDALVGCDRVTARATVRAACAGKPHAAIEAMSPAGAAFAGGAVVVNASASVSAIGGDASTLTYSWSMLPATVRRAGANPATTVADAPALRPYSASGLGSGSLEVLSRSWAGGVSQPTLTLVGTGGGASLGGGSLARFVPDGVGDYRVRVVVSDGCESDVADVVVRVRCPSEVSAAASADESTPLGSAAVPWSAGASLSTVTAFWFAAEQSSIGSSAADVTQGPVPSSAGVLTAAGVTVRFALHAAARPVSAAVAEWRLVSSPAASSLRPGLALGGGVGPLTANQSDAVTLDVAGAYTAEATVTDGCAAVRVRSTVVVAPDAPALFAGGRYDAAAMGASAAGAASRRLADVRYIDARGVLVSSSEAAAPVAGLSVAWAVVSSPVGSAGTTAALLSPPSGVLSPVFTPDVKGRYVLRLTVTDAAMASGATTPSGRPLALSDDVIVDASCGPAPLASITGAPVVLAQLEPPPVLGGARAAVSLSAGQGTTDADTALASLTLAWEPTMSSVRRPGSGAATDVDAAASAVAQSSASLLGASDYSSSGTPSGASVSFVPDGVGTYGLRVTASDGCSADTAFAAVEVRCGDSGLAAVAAGPDVSVSVPAGQSLPASVTVTATATTGSGLASLATALVVRWRVESAPPGSSLRGTTVAAARVSNVAQPVAGASSAVFRLSSSAAFTPDAAGSYTFRVTVSDGCKRFDTVVTAGIVAEGAVVCPTASATPSPTMSPSPTATSTTTPTGTPTASVTPSSGSSPPSTASPSGTAAPVTSAAATPTVPAASATATATPTRAPLASTCPALPSVGVTQTSTESSVSFSLDLPGATAAQLRDEEVLGVLRRQIAAAAGVDASRVTVTAVTVPTARARALQAAAPRVAVRVGVAAGQSAASTSSSIESAVASGAIREGINADSVSATKGLNVTSASLQERPVIERETTNTVAVQGDEAVPMGLFIAAAVFACIFLLLLLIVCVVCARSFCCTARREAHDKAGGVPKGGRPQPGAGGARTDAAEAGGVPPGGLPRGASPRTSPRHNSGSRPGSGVSTPTGMAPAGPMSRQPVAGTTPLASRSSFRQAASPSTPSYRADQAAPPGMGAASQSFRQPRASGPMTPSASFRMQPSQPTGMARSPSLQRGGASSYGSFRQQPSMTPTGSYAPGAPPGIGGAGALASPSAGRAPPVSSPSFSRGPAVGMSTASRAVMAANRARGATGAYGARARPGMPGSLYRGQGAANIASSGRLNPRA